MIETKDHERGSKPGPGPDRRVQAASDPVRAGMRGANHVRDGARMVGTRTGSKP